MAYTRPAAPGALEDIESFCNSARFLHDEDAFADLPSTRAWLRTHVGRKTGQALDESGRQELLRLREAIREHLAGAEHVRETLNHYARTTLQPPQWPLGGDAVIMISDGSEIGGLIGSLLRALAVEELAGRRARLKVCRSPDCRWVFYDRSPGNNSVWCSMSICGARHKMRSYRTRLSEEGHDRG